MTTRQKIHDATLAKWLGLIHDQRASGMTVKDWCADNNISVHALYYWKRIAKTSYVDAVIPDIIPLSAPTLSEITGATCATSPDGLRGISLSVVFSFTTPKHKNLFTTGTFYLFFTFHFLYLASPECHLLAASSPPSFSAPR